MQIGMVGLGRMGSNMVQRLLQKGHECVVYDSHPEAVAQARGHGAKGCADLAELVSTLSRPRVLWLMVPAAVVDGVLESLLPLMDKDDIVIAGGNSSYHDAIRRAADLADDGSHYIDVGTSGGLAGLDRGSCLMIGGESDPFKQLEPVFSVLATGADQEIGRAAGRGKGWQNV